VIPSSTILAEPPVTWVDRVTRRRGTEEVARAYLEFLYTEKGQEIAAHNFYRPRNPAVAARFASQFGTTKLFTVDELFGGWNQAQKVHFADGGIFDQIVQSNR
jgi:sulfate transport system substrate-binding protein